MELVNFLFLRHERYGVDSLVSGHLEEDSLEPVESSEIHADLLLPANAHVTGGKVCLDGVLVGFLGYGFEGAYGGLDGAGSIALPTHPEAVV